MSDYFQQLAALIARSQRAKFGRGVPSEIVADAEHYLGMSFPPSYRWWLLNYGGGYIGGYELMGLAPIPIAERDAKLPLIGDIIDLAHRNEATSGHPLHLFEILTYDGDETFFFDTQRRSEDGEWPIVRVCAGMSEPEDVAATFADFLWRELR